MEENKSKVYVLPDNEGRILRCEGGYTMANIDDPALWVQIDEGFDDRCNLCQTHYFEGGLYTEDGIPRYKLEDGTAVARTTEEIEADMATLPEPEETLSQEERIRELEEALDMILRGETA